MMSCSSVATRSIDKNAANFDTPTNRCKISQILKSGDYRALHWTHLFETLRHTVDAIYEICQVDRSVIECKEAIIILENYTKDFVGLIEFLNAEDAWELSDRPTSIAWEIRKTAGYSNKRFLSFKNDLQHMCHVENTFESAIGLLKQKPNFAQDMTPIKTELGPDVQPTMESMGQADVLRVCKSEGLSEVSEEDGWKVVSYAKNRSKSGTAPGGGNFSPTQFDYPAMLKSPTGFSTPVGHSKGRPIFPKNATEIRQTKASLAKMEHNRQYLAEQRRKEVDEWSKSVRHRFPSGYGVPHHHCSSSMPSLEFNFQGSTSPHQKSAPNYTDTSAVQRLNARSKNLRLISGKSGRKNRFRSYQSMESLCSLESIKEADDEANACVGPTLADQNLSNENNATQISVENQIKISIDLSDQRDGDQNTLKTVHQKIEQICIGNVENVENDEGEVDEEERRTWQYLTEEEESLAQEEEILQKEIEEERKSIDLEVSRRASVDGGPDNQWEGGAEELEKQDDGLNNNQTNEIHSVPLGVRSMTWQELVSRWKAEFPSSPVCLDDFCQMDLSEVRLPGQAAQMHEKLSSPSRKRNNIDDTIRKQEERQAKAEQLRQKLLKEQQTRLSKLFRRVDEVRAQKVRLLEKKRVFMENRLANATENRSHQLLAKVKKAKGEDEKVHEIAFINSLEADNKRHDVYSKQQDHEHRLQTLQEERLRKVEEKAAREQAVEERRKAAEEERQTKVRELAERTKRRLEQIDQQRTEQEICRQQAAKEKARERCERMAERRAARQANTDELLQRIQQKQEDSSRRHEENLELIKQRANEMSNLRSHAGIMPEMNENSQNGISVNEVTKEKLDKTLAATQTEKNLKFVSIDPEAENLKISFKRRQKIKQKFISKYKEFLQHKTKSAADDDSLRTRNSNVVKCDSYINVKFQKVDKDIEKIFTDCCGVEKQWLPSDIHTLEKSLNETSRIFRSSQNLNDDQEFFYGLKSRDALLKIFALLEKSDSGGFPLPFRCVTNIVSVLQLSIHKNLKLSLQVLYHGQILLFVNALSTQLKVLSDYASQCKGTSATIVNNKNACMSLFCLVNDFMTSLSNFDLGLCKELLDSQFCGVAQYSVRNMLLVSYIVACRCIDYVGKIVKHATSADSLLIENSALIAECVHFCNLLTRLLFMSLQCGKSKENKTKFLENLKETELCSLISFAYSLLLNPFNLDSHLIRATLPEDHSILVVSILDFLNLLAVLDIKFFQDVLSEERNSLEFRHIASFLICYTNKHSMPEILHKVIVTVGMFTRCNRANQSYVHAGTQPSILQQLCVLPFPYFSDPHLCNILVPTLISCCYDNEDNRRLLEEELSGQLLADFIEDFLDNELSVPLKWDDEFDLRNRFPRSEFEKAKDFFCLEGFRLKKIFFSLFK